MVAAFNVQQDMDSPLRESKGGAKATSLAAEASLDLLRGELQQEHRGGALLSPRSGVKEAGSHSGAAAEPHANPL